MELATLAMSMAAKSASPLILISVRYARKDLSSMLWGSVGVSPPGKRLISLRNVLSATSRDAILAKGMTQTFAFHALKA